MVPGIRRIREGIARQIEGDGNEGHDHRREYQNMRIVGKLFPGVAEQKPQRKSVLEELRRLEAEAKRKPRRSKSEQHRMEAR